VTSAGGFNFIQRPLLNEVKTVISFTIQRNDRSLRWMVNEKRDYSSGEATVEVVVIMVKV